MGCNSIHPSRILSKILRYMGGLWKAYGYHVQSVGFETKADCRVIMVNGKVQKRGPEERHWGI